jgi:hypothetical protein
VTAPPRADDNPDPESPGVPGFSTWPAVYLFVFGWFVLVVVLLTLFTAMFA